MNYAFTGIDMDKLAERVGCIEQLAYMRRSTLEDGRARGMRVVDVADGGGLNFTVNLERGMDITTASYKGIPLAWRSSVREAHPAFYEREGANWLRSCGGGMLFTCGLRNVGAPSSFGGEEFGLHGRISHLPAEDVSSCKEWLDERYFQTLSGKVRQAAMFGENLLLSRKITTTMGENSIILEDSICNQGFKSSPLMLLYHINFGWPLVDAAATLEAVEHQVEPRDTTAAAGIDSWMKMTSPQAGYSEQVFYHDLPGDADGHSCITLKNPQLGLAVKLEFRKEELPNMIEWKQMGRGEYVLGLEPANCRVGGIAAEKAAGTLTTLAPGEKTSTWLKITVIEL